MNLNIPNARNMSNKELCKNLTKEITTLKKVQSKNLSKGIALEIRNLNKANTSDFGISLTNINVTVNYGEILGIAGIAGNGQTELMEILSGETICDKEDQIFLDGVPIGFEDITKRRKLGIETIPEERTLHATVPNLKINENTFLTYFPKYNQNKSFIGKILNNPENSLVESEQIIKENDVRCPEPNPMASQLSGGNLQKFILGRSLANNPKVAIFSQPTWGVDIGAATTIRQKLLNLSQTGKAVILISQDLEEIFQLSDKIAVLNNGNLSEVLSANDISAANVGLLMGGNSKSQNDQEESK